MRGSAVARIKAQNPSKSTVSTIANHVVPVEHAPQNSHSGPIPTDGRLFKRLEHLKR